MTLLSRTSTIILFQKFEELVGKHPTDEDILSKKQEIKAIHETIASDKDKLTQLQQQKEDLLLKIEFMKRMQSTAGQERDQLAAGKSLFTSDGRLGPSSHSRFKFRRFQSVESISILKERDTFEEKQDPVDFPTQTLTVKTQWTGNERSEISTGEEQLQVARQLVKKNRRIFELEQVGYQSEMHFYAPAPTTGGFTLLLHARNHKLMALSM